MSPFSGMNRADRRLSSDDAEEILRNGKVGTLSVSGVEGYPYGIPMNYVYDRGLLQFHTSSRDGLLLRSLRSNPRASFCVFEHVCNSKYRSVIAFGILSIEGDKKEIIERIIDKYVPKPYNESSKKNIGEKLEHMCGLSLTIEHLTAKYVDKPGE
ncbi:pyridoxamine 5'-phosphate oxidase family protein [Candidatus Methanoprimaticola sp. MG2]|uniref:pyridoxamine 5'-phosphate oxidase family protein n=1 Tax=Candidatus Methanoprimaticola sp. MG2 TaxID=3228838 RepID=UPI0039C658F2